MTTAEKEAIDDLKLTIERDKEELPYSKESLKNKQTILNYIDKLQKEFKDLELAYGLYKDRYETLQKENAELKEENASLKKENETLKEENFDQVYMKAIADYKDKIRNKIKELEEIKLLQTDSIFMDSLNGATSILKELLGDDNNE